MLVFLSKYFLISDSGISWATIDFIRSCFHFKTALMMPPNLILVVATQGIFETLENGAATNRCSHLFHVRKFSVVDEFSQPKAADLVALFISSQTAWSGLLLFLSALFLPVRTSIISLSSYNNSLLSWRSYILAPVAGQILRSTIDGILLVLSTRLQSDECIHSEIAALCSGSRKVKNKGQ